MNELTPAARLVQQAAHGLSRYRQATSERIELEGALEDVSTTGDGDAWLDIRAVKGLHEWDLVTATVHQPKAHVDALLVSIGAGGRITLAGQAQATARGIAKLRLSEIETINGVDVMKAPTPAAEKD